MTILRLRRDDLTWSDIGGETVLLDLEQSRYFSAKGPGAVLLNLLIDGATNDQLVAEIVQKYDVTSVVAQGDIDDFLTDLERRNLLDTTEA